MRLIHEVIEDLRGRPDEDVHLARLPAGPLVLNGVLAKPREFVALRQGIADLPCEITRELWVIAPVGRGGTAVSNRDSALAAAGMPTGRDIVKDLSTDADLQHCLHKGLYGRGVAAPVGDVR